MKELKIININDFSRHLQQLSDRDEKCNLHIWASRQERRKFKSNMYSFLVGADTYSYLIKK